MTDKHRSAAFERALTTNLVGRHEVEAARRYVVGYMRAPESAAEVSVARAAATHAFASEPCESAS